METKRVFLYAFNLDPGAGPACNARNIRERWGDGSAPPAPPARSAPVRPCVHPRLSHAACGSPRGCGCPQELGRFPQGGCARLPSLPKVVAGPVNTLPTPPVALGGGCLPGPWPQGRGSPRLQCTPAPPIAALSRPQCRRWPCTETVVPAPHARAPRPGVAPASASEQVCAAQSFPGTG